MITPNNTPQYTAMSIFHQNQKEAASGIINGFLNRQPFTVLLAQMQSGKSGTYLFTAFEMVRLGMVDHFCIICGSSDISLREQVKVTLKDAALVFSESLGDWEKDRISRASLGVFFSQDMKKAPKIDEKTLIIHDESHMAQSRNNIPLKFYKRNKLDQALFGDFSQLREKNNYILGVSATPFSELVSNKKVKLQDWTDEEANLLDGISLDTKNFFMMEPGQGYIGISDLIRSGSIMFEAENIKPDDCSHVSSVLRDNFHKYSKKYIIIRTHRAQADADMVMTISSSLGYKYVSIFGGSGSGINIADLENEPEHSTIVHICGRFRMGQVVPKRHIGMVYEQSKNPKADTTLQGLVGRMCGYRIEGAQTDIDIYVSPQSEGSIRIYESAWSEMKIDSLTRITEALNLGGRRRKNKGDVVLNKQGQFIKTVPIKFRLKDIEADNGQATRPSEITIHNLENFLEDNPRIVSQNPDGDQILDYIKRVAKGCASMKPPHNYLETTPELEGKYQSALAEGRRANFTRYHCYYAEESNCSFSLYGHKTSTCKANSVYYLVGYILYDESIHGAIKEELAQVDPKCNYIPGEIMNEDESVLLNTNGGQTIGFPAEVFDNHKLFKEELKKAVLRTDTTHTDYIPTCSHSINSLYDKKTQAFVGIKLEPSVYTDKRIKKIIQYFEKKHGITLKFSKARGRKSVNYTRYASISWGQ